MIEDARHKQDRFARILTRCNEMLAEQGSAVRFKPGFDLDPSVARKQSQDPQSLYEALLDADSLYLVDLELLEEGNARATFLQLLRQTGESWSEEAIQEYERLVKQDTPLAKTIFKFGNSLVFLIAAKQLGRRCLLVSGEERAFSNVKAVENAGLADVYEPFSDSKDHDSNSAKVEIDAWARRIIRYVNKLDDLRALTDGWFGPDQPEVRQDEQSVAPERFKPSHKLIESVVAQERACIQKVFSWVTDDWFSQSSAEDTHALFKATVGNHADWMGGDYPLPLGGAYIILMTVLSDAWPTSLEDVLVKDPGCFFDGGALIGFLPRQGKESATQSIRWLYEFFVAISMIDREEKKGKPGILRIEEPRAGRKYFALVLDWGDQRFAEFAAKLRARVDALLTTNKQTIPPEQTVGCWLRFLLASQVHADSGAGSVGRLRLEKPYLKVGLFND